MYPEHAIKVYREYGGTAPRILNLVTIIPTSQRRHQDSKSSLLIPFREITAVFVIIMQNARTHAHTQCMYVVCMYIYCIYNVCHTYTFLPGYNDIGLFDTSSITTDILWYQLIPHC